jgi:hypothetical protein
VEILSNKHACYDLFVTFDCAFMGFERMVVGK